MNWKRIAIIALVTVILLKAPHETGHIVRQAFRSGADFIDSLGLH